MSKHYPDIPERIFMNTLLKHTGIALAIIIPLAAYVTFAEAATIDKSSSISLSNSSLVLLQNNEHNLEQ